MPERPAAIYGRRAGYRGGISAAAQSGSARIADDSGRFDAGNDVSLAGAAKASRFRGDRRHGERPRDQLELAGEGWLEFWDKRNRCSTAKRPKSNACL